MDSLKLRQFLARYLEGKTTPAEEKMIDNWYERLEEEASVAFMGREEEKTREDIWNLIRPELSVKQAKIIKLRSRWLQVAAAVVIIATATAILLLNTSGPAKLRKQHVFLENFSVLTTLSRERKIVCLPDGSVLTLNSASSIHISNDFTKARKVEIIDGEVYFDVKHDSSRPFVIRSGPLTTQVLGTAFNIRAYKGLNKIIVGVSRGKVGVMRTDSPVTFLEKDRELIYDKPHAQISLKPLEENVALWQQGFLVLNDETFDDMAVLMMKNFGLKMLTMDQSVKSKRFTATLNTSMPLVKALEVIAAIHHLKIKKRRDSIEIY